LSIPRSSHSSSFFSTAPSPTDIYTLSLHDALPISTPNAAAYGKTALRVRCGKRSRPAITTYAVVAAKASVACDEGNERRLSRSRSEEHTSELQSPYDLVCRLLLEKKNEKENRT